VLKKHTSNINTKKKGKKQMQMLQWRDKHQVPIYFGTAPDATIARIATESIIFQNWFNKLDPEFELKEVTITQVDFKGKGTTPADVLFVRLRARTSKSPHEQHVELRGGTSAMLVNLTCTDDGSIHTVLTCQSRVPAGDFRYIEIPAGMVDGGSFLGAAAREIEEELGIRFNPSELTDLTETLPKGQNGLHLSPGLLDEQCKIFLAERNVTRRELDAMKGRKTGVLGEGEFIQLLIVPIKDLCQYTSDAKSILAYFLYKEYITK
jgi:ADP-sugar diphosphatase